MTLSLNHFRIVKPYNTLALDQGDSYTTCEGTLAQAIDSIAVDTRIASKDCIINEDEGYAINKTQDWVTIITVETDHPIACAIACARQSLRIVHKIARL